MRNGAALAGAGAFATRRFAIRLRRAIRSFGSHLNELSFSPAIGADEGEHFLGSVVVQRLAAEGLALPAAAAPAANYLPYVISQKLLLISGQLPMVEGKVEVTGRLGAEVTLEAGQEAARLCALNLLAQARAAAGGDLTRVARCLKLGGFVACTPDFTDHPKVINGASDLIALAMGEAGRHSRFAVGSASLPLGAAVEVEAIFELV
jgi:enamine deaminase RidA (YjgF/YER057c/UK114 family)